MPMSGHAMSSRSDGVCISYQVGARPGTPVCDSVRREKQTAFHPPASIVHSLATMVSLDITPD